MKDAYADDICGSVNTRQEATALMSDEDEVLEGGGFYIRHWISTTQASETQDNLKLQLEASSRAT